MSTLVAGLQIERHLARVVVLDAGPQPLVVDVAEVDLPVSSSNVERVARLSSLWTMLGLTDVATIVVSLGSVTFATEEARRAGVRVVDSIAAGPTAATRALVAGSAGIVVMHDREDPVAVVVGGPGGQLPAPAAGLASGPVPGFVAAGTSGHPVAPGAGQSRSSGADLLRLVGQPRLPVPLRSAGFGLAPTSPTPDPVAVLAFGAALVASDRVTHETPPPAPAPVAPPVAPAAAPTVAPASPASPSVVRPEESGASATVATETVPPPSPLPARPPAAEQPRHGDLRAVLGGAAKGVVAGLVAVAVFASPLGDRRPFVPVPETTTATAVTASTVRTAGTFSDDCRDVGAVVLNLGPVDVPLDTTVLFEGTSAVLTTIGRTCTEDVATVLSFAPTRTLEVVSAEVPRAETFAQAVRVGGVDPARVQVVAPPPGAAGLVLRFTDG